MRRNGRDRAKVIALSAILLVVWAVVGVRYAILSRQWRAKMSAAHHQYEQDMARVAGPGTRPEQPSAPRAESRPASLITPVAPPVQDPFLPVLARRGSGGATTPVGTTAEEEELTPLPPPPMEAYPTVGEESLRLTGIVMGTPSIAVVRHGGKHHLVRVGDRLDGELRVQAISRDTVTFQDGKKTYQLRLGR